MLANGYPNLFFAPLFQSSQAANNVFTLEVAAEHIAHFMATAEETVGGGDAGAEAVVEVTREAEEAWSMEVMRHAAWFASVRGCTPGYITLEGESLRLSEDPAVLMKAARSSNLSGGMPTFMKVLEEYRADGGLKGVEVTSASA